MAGSVYTHQLWGREGDQFTGTAAVPGHATQQHALGTKLILDDGREYRYVKNGGSAQAAGKLYQSKVVGANFDELAVAAAAAGATEVTVTNGATTITKNQFAGGYLGIEDDAGEGRLYQIASHPAEAAGSAAFVVTLASPKGLRVALTSASTVVLLENKYDSIIIHPSPNTAALVGVAVEAMTASYFGWVQTRGLCSVLTDGTIVIGDSVMASDAVDGAVEAWILTEGTPNTEITPRVGQVASVSVDTEYSVVDLWL